MTWTSTGITEWPTTRAGLNHVVDALQEGVNYFRAEKIAGGHMLEGSPVTSIDDPRWERDYLAGFKLRATPTSQGHVEPMWILTPATHPYIAGGSRNIGKEVNRLITLASPYAARWYWE